MQCFYQTKIKSLSKEGREKETERGKKEARRGEKRRKERKGEKRNSERREGGRVILPRRGWQSVPRTPEDLVESHLI